jgi:hypothetical protein
MGFICQSGGFFALSKQAGGYTASHDSAGKVKQGIGKVSVSVSYDSMRARIYVYAWQIWIVIFRPEGHWEGKHHRALSLSSVWR